MSPEIHNPANFLHDPEATDMWDGCSADADMGLGFSCSPRNAPDASDMTRAASTESASGQAGSRPRNP